MIRVVDLKIQRSVEAFDPEGVSLPLGRAVDESE